MNRSICTPKETFRRNRRAEGMRPMEIWLAHEEIEAIDSLKRRLNLNSRSEAMKHLVSTLCVPRNPHATEAVAK